MRFSFKYPSHNIITNPEGKGKAKLSSVDHQYRSGRGRSPQITAESPTFSHNERIRKVYETLSLMILSYQFLSTFEDHAHNPVTTSFQLVFYPITGLEIHSRGKIAPFPQTVIRQIKIGKLIISSAIRNSLKQLVTGCSVPVHEQASDKGNFCGISSS